MVKRKAEGDCCIPQRCMTHSLLEHTHYNPKNTRRHTQVVASSSWLYLPWCNSRIKNNTRDNNTPGQSVSGQGCHNPIILISHSNQSVNKCGACVRNHKSHWHYLYTQNKWTTCSSWKIPSTQKWKGLEIIITPAWLAAWNNMSNMCSQFINVLMIRRELWCKLTVKIRMTFNSPHMFSCKSAFTHFSLI